MSGLLPIVCDNCGAKYKLPESFTGSQSKCQKCGSVIAVDAQRQQASTASAAAKPATGARPAVARSSEPPAARPAMARSAAASTGRDRGPERRGGRERRGKDAGAKSRMPLVLGVIGLVVIATVVAVIKMRG